MLSLGRFLSQRAATLSAQSEHIPSGKKEKRGSRQKPTQNLAHLKILFSISLLAALRKSRSPSI